MISCLQITNFLVLTSIFSPCSETTCLLLRKPSLSSLLLTEQLFHVIAVPGTIQFPTASGLHRKAKVIELLFKVRS